MSTATVRSFKIRPIDSWFFRDGRPFVAGEAHATDVRSLFPPHASTVVGFMRFAFARGLGWDGRGRWPREFDTLLGDGADLGPLHFQGPFLWHRDEPIFPAPLHLLGRVDNGEWKDFSLLTPGNPCDCDLGRMVRLPVPTSPQAGLKDLAGLYLSRSAWEAVLAGEIPVKERPLAPDNLWSDEFRVGIGRNAETRSVKEGHLYSFRHVRLHDETALVTQLSGMPENHAPLQLLNFGGESRMAELEEFEANGPFLPTMGSLEADADGMLRFTISLLSPGDVVAETFWRTPGAEWPGVSSSTIVSACVGTPVRAGGWDSLAHGPVAQTPFLPAGSTWFCTAPATALDIVRSLHGSQIGGRQPFGYGLIAVGAWKERN